MVEEIRSIDKEEFKKLMDKYDVGRVFINGRRYRGYKVPLGINKIRKSKNISSPLFYFRKPKKMSDEEYGDYLAMFSYLFVYAPVYISNSD